MTKEQINVNVTTRISELTYNEVRELKRLHIEQLNSAATLVTDFITWVKNYIVFQLEFLWHVTKEVM